LKNSMENLRQLSAATKRGTVLCSTDIQCVLGSDFFNMDSNVVVTLRN
jgi:hypothetical protein